MTFTRAIFSVCVFTTFVTRPILALADNKAESTPPNIVLILVDDLRHDVFGHAGHPFIETPRIDRLAQQGVSFQNAFVTTSLCSPARASFLTGQYMHRHRVVDNQSRIPSGTFTFPQRLQQAGYATAFIGKWHMGGTSDAPRPGFDHWVSFKGQGAYFPKGQKLNVDDKLLPQQEYMTDELTRYAVRWLEQQQSEKPFLLYLSHKGVHGLYDPAPRHRDRYRDAPWRPPASMANTSENYAGKPMWVFDQRNSWHGVDFAYHGRARQTIKQMVRHYSEMVLSIDDSLGAILDTLESQNLSQNTLVIFTSDGGHLWGEHGLIDKRCAYEESIRIPMILKHPTITPQNKTRPEIVANIDLAPTLLELADIEIPAEIDGQSFANLLSKQAPPEPNRNELLYEYYWEPAFPQTPTVFALRTERYKLIQYHGIWDQDELYDLKSDPQEMQNLIGRPEHQQRVKQMRQRLYQKLKQSDGLNIPLGFKRNAGSNRRSKQGPPRAEFPQDLMEEK